MDRRLDMREAKMRKIPSVMSIAGSDSSGGAGIQADIKTIQAMQLFATTAITSITVQNTCGVSDVFDVPPKIVSEQIAVVFEDIPPSAVKVGMVSSPKIVDAIAEALAKAQARNIVVDPVMVATSGSNLMEQGAIPHLVEKLMPMARVITPNIPEGEVLSGMDIRSEDDMKAACAAIAKMLKKSGARAGFRFAQLEMPAILLKGGHFEDAPVLKEGAAGTAEVANDLLMMPDGHFVWLRGNRVQNPNSHGTGCTLSSAIACGLAKGKDVVAACKDAKAFVTGALGYGLDLGKGSGPMNHMWRYM